MMAGNYRLYPKVSDQQRGGSCYQIADSQDKRIPDIRVPDAIGVVEG
jgi:hypothetical protein